MERDKVEGYFERQAVTVGIIDTFVRPGAPRIVAISDECRNQIMSSEWSRYDLFDQAMSEVIKVLRESCVEEFELSSALGKLRNAAEIKVNEEAAIRKANLFPGEQGRWRKESNEAFTCSITSRGTKSDTASQDLSALSPRAFGSPSSWLAGAAPPGSGRSDSGQVSAPETLDSGTGCRRAFAAEKRSPENRSTSISISESKTESPLRVKLVRSNMGEEDLELGQAQPMPSFVSPASSASPLVGVRFLGLPLQPTSSLSARAEDNDRGRAISTGGRGNVITDVATDLMVEVSDDDGIDDVFFSSSNPLYGFSGIPVTAISTAGVSSAGDEAPGQGHGEVLDDGSESCFARESGVSLARGREGGRDGEQKRSEKRGRISYFFP